LVCWAATRQEYQNSEEFQRPKNEIVSPAPVGYAGGVLWKKTWQTEVVLMLFGGVVLSFVIGNLTVELLQQAAVPGFKTLSDTGSVLLSTLCFHGAAIVLGILFLKLHNVSLTEALGLDDPKIKRNSLLAIGVLIIVLPLMLGLKYLSELLLHKIGWPLESQRAVEIFAASKSVWLRAYLVLFAVLVAPAAEEFVFRGLLFSAAKKMGWPKCAWIVTSLLFAAIHNSAPIFLPLFVFALALTWLYEKTDGLLAPIVAHSLFNATNLVMLMASTK
jgi:membrane protease YdiL (CAAX protease family)